MIDQKTFSYLKEIGLFSACDFARNELKDINTYEDFIKLDNAPEYVFHMCDKYQKYIDESIVSELEDVIVTKPYISYLYAKYVIQGSWPKCESIIATDPSYAYRYAKFVIQGPWPKGEDAIATDPYYLQEYNRFLERVRSND